MSLSLRLRDLEPRRAETIVWALTDGVRFYRGSSVPALARLEGFARFGSPSTAAHLAQDKFASLALASAAGLAVPPTLLMEGESEIAALGRWPGAAGPLFVKPNTLGAKIGIFRGQPLRKPRGGEGTRRDASGAAIATGRSSSRSSTATTSG